MKKIISSTKWLITYLIILFVLISLDISGIVLTVCSIINSDSSLLAIGLVVLVYMLPVTGIILFYLNRRACLVWVEDGVLKHKGLLFGYRGNITAEKVYFVSISYGNKKIRIIIDGDNEHHRKRVIELKNNDSNMLLVKSFWKGEIFNPNEYLNQMNNDIDTIIGGQRND